MGVVIGLLFSACGHPGSPGVVDGHFLLPGRSAADLQRGGLNFSVGAHGGGNSHTARVNADGSYTVSLPPGSYSVIGGLSQVPGGQPAEACDQAITVIVTANSTTTTNFECHATPVTSIAP
ncbi:MAG: hypothetical protein JWM34_4437 [Ilumatobacteraceae bacterium]|nr:hypothetical protein [Ilumatobacteraceae bacterium]